MLPSKEDDDATDEQPVEEEAPVAEETEDHAEPVAKETEVRTEEPTVADSPEGGAVATEEAAEVDNGPQIPEHATYILIGAGTAAYSAQKAISKRDPKARVRPFNELAYVAYFRTFQLLFWNDPKI